MADWEDVRRIALGLPGTTERTSRGTPQWRVQDKLFTWDRPLRRTDAEALAALGATAPDGPILAARVPHLEAKEALLAADSTVYFTIPHFDGYLAILTRLDQITVNDLEELVVEAWLCRAPKRLVNQYLDTGYHQ